MNKWTIVRSISDGLLALVWYERTIQAVQNNLTTKGVIISLLIVMVLLSITIFAIRKSNKNLTVQGAINQLWKDVIIIIILNSIGFILTPLIDKYVFHA